MCNRSNIFACILVVAAADVGGCAGEAKSRGRPVYSSRQEIGYVSESVAREAAAVLSLKGYTVRMPTDWETRMGSPIRASRTDESLPGPSGPIQVGTTREITITSIHLDNTWNGVEISAKAWFHPSLAKYPWAGLVALNDAMLSDQNRVIEVLTERTPSPSP